MTSTRDPSSSPRKNRPNITTTSERIDGVTFEQLRDPDLPLRNREKRHKNGRRNAGFPEGRHEDIRRHIAELIDGGFGSLPDRDFDAVLTGSSSAFFADRFSVPEGFGIMK